MFSLSELQAREAPNRIVELKPLMKNLDLKVIVIEKGQGKELKNKEWLYQCTVADQTGKIFCNFFGEVGEKLKPGDIVFLMSGYTSIFNSHLILYQSAKGSV